MTCILLLWDEALYIYQFSPFHIEHCSMPHIFVNTFLEDLSIFDSGVLKSPSIIVLLSIFFLKSSRNFLMYLGPPLLGAYMFTMFVLLMNSPLGYYKVSFWVSFLAFVLNAFVRYKYCSPHFFFSYFVGIFISNPLLSACVSL